MELRRPILAVLTAASLGCAHSPGDHRSAPTAGARAQTSAQAEAIAPASGTVFVGCGYLVVENSGPTHLTVLIDGKEVRQAKKGESVFIVDGVLVETTSATAAEIGVPLARGSALLRSYMKWESAFSTKKNGWPKLNVESEPVQLGIPDVDGLIWGYDFPSPIEVLGQEVVRIAYLTASIDDVVFVASAPARQGDDVHAIYRTLGRIVRSIKRQPEPIDLLDLSAHLKATKKPWAGCSEPAR